MLEEMIILASYGYGSSIGDVFFTLEQNGFFSLVLPFLLLFALVYGILKRTKIFKENNAVNGIIALSVGLMALQFNFVTVFFAELFPRVGIALSIILAIMIIIGLFADPDSKGVTYGMLAVSVIIIIIVLLNTSDALGWQAGSWWTSGGWVTAAIWVGVVVLVIVIVTSGSNGGSDSSAGGGNSPFARSLRGGGN